MLNISVYKDGLTMLGHADYARRGQDIVCSACSSAMYLAVELLSAFTDVHTKILPGDTEVYVEEQCDMTEIVLNSFYKYMKQLSNQYPKHISVKQYTKKEINNDKN